MHKKNMVRDVYNILVSIVHTMILFYLISELDTRIKTMYLISNEQFFYVEK